MDAIEFVQDYPKFLSEIEDVIKPGLLPILQELKDTDPHDLVTPESWFVNPNQARGFVWGLFLKKCKRAK
ncbi:MAG TPA: hypothetical protein VFK73_06540 [Paludibacter sp.]|nr:hypothetical protein [Paludibacter sp.]